MENPMYLTLNLCRVLACAEKDLILSSGQTENGDFLCCLRLNGLSRKYPVQDTWQRNKETGR